MTRANLASVRNEAECINTTLDAGRKAWLIIDGGPSLIFSAFAAGGILYVRLDEAVFERIEVAPSSVLPGGRGVWEQIEIEAPAGQVRP